MDLFIYEYRIGDCSQSVSRQNQLKRHAHMETVLRVMEQRYAEMSDSPNRMYVGKKLECVLLSYFVTTLLADSNRKEGRVLAGRELERCKDSAPRVASALERKYMIFLFMNRLHMTDVTWGKILESSLYKHAMRKMSFSYKHKKVQYQTLRIGLFCVSDERYRTVARTSRDGEKFYKIINNYYGLSGIQCV